jgi:uncharacterized protein (TIGR03437 family)
VRSETDEFAAASENESVPTMPRHIFTIAICLLSSLLPLQSQPRVSISPGGIVNAASYAAASPVVPGSVAAAFGDFPVASPTSATIVPLPVSLGGVSLSVSSGQMAPLFFASSTEVNFQVPWELAGSSQVSVAGQSVAIAPFAPGIFAINAQGTGQGVIVDPTYRVVDGSNPAIAGSTVVLIYATGLGSVSNQPATGSPSPSSPLARTMSPPTVMIGGAPATVQFSGLAPGLIGVYQINALVPAASTTGNSVPVSISIGGATSNTVTMAVTGGTSPNPVPSISELSPYAASPGNGSLALTISGAGFVAGSTVSFNGQTVATSFVNATQLTATVSASQLASAGNYPVAIVNPSPGGGNSNAVNFIVQRGFGSGPASSVAWSGLARDAQHTSLSLIASQPLNRIRWSTPVDLDPQYSQGELLIHYGSPLITPGNTVLIPVKTGATSGFRIEAHNGVDGTMLWTFATDYALPPHDWVPEFAPAMTPTSRVYVPGPGGTVYYRDAPDSATGPQGQMAFYGMSNYLANGAAYNSNVMISTPITSDASGNIYFGFQVTGSTPLQLQSGIARIGAGGDGIWISATSAASDPAITRVQQNCAPALNQSEDVLYIAVSNGDAGYLLALNSTTLQTMSKVLLKDPHSGLNATVSDNASASPTIGPDGDVYFGVLENQLGSNHERGWLLHFDSRLATTKTPAAFGWDDTASVVPSFMVPSYSGGSSYLLMTKYNDYADGGGSGENRLAVLDPGATESDPVTGETVMKEVVTVLGPTPNPALGGVKEWCIDAAAVDPATNSILAGSEDGKLYRWDLRTNTLSQTIVLTPGLGEAYTPTLIAPDGTVYAINNATLFAVGQ